MQRNLERARAEARNVTQAAPRAAVNLPAPGAGHPVTVAMYPSNRVGGSLFGQFVNGLAAARERAEERYAYTEAALDYGRNASTFSISTSLDAVVTVNPDLVIFFRADQADLLANDRLAPLDDFLVSGPGLRLRRLLARPAGDRPARRPAVRRTGGGLAARAAVQPQAGD